MPDRPAGVRPGWTIPESSDAVNQAAAQRALLALVASFQKDNYLDIKLVRVRDDSDMGLQKRVDESPSAEETAQRQTAEYVARMAGELRAMTTKANLGFLSYLLSMVEDEAAREGTTRSSK